MQALTFRKNGRVGLAVSHDGTSFHGLVEGDAGYPGSLDDLIRLTEAERAAAIRALDAGAPVNPATVETLQPLAARNAVIAEAA